MPNPFCILPQHADAFLDKVKSGELAPDKLAKMSSEERRSAFAEIVGEAAASKVNASFESRLLLKSQQKAITDWIARAGKLAPDVKRDLLSRVDRMQNILDPKTSQPFLQDLAKQRLGFGVTQEEAANIVHLSKNVADAKAAMTSGGDRMDYGRALVDFREYTGELKAGAKGALARLKEHPVLETAGFLKSFKIIGDLSALLNQGFKTMTTSPGIWAKTALQAFVNTAKEFGGADMIREVKADVWSRPLALDGTYKKMGLDLGVREEAIPSAVPEKIPVVGRFFKATEAGYMGFQLEARANLADKYYEIAQKSRWPTADVTDPAELESMGRLVNSLTGRGYMGRAEAVAEPLNVLFFSPRQMKSDWDVLTAHQFQKGVTPFVRRQAAQNMVKIIAGTAGILAFADRVHPGSVEWDPRSAHFAHIKVGNTWFRVGPLTSLAVLGARLAILTANAITGNKTPAIKSSTTGKLSQVNSGKFGAQTGSDLVTNFLENKLSPAASVVKDLLNDKMFGGEPLTIGGELKNVSPFPVENAIDIAKGNPNANSAEVMLGTLADALGAMQNTPQPKQGKKGGSSGGSHSTPITIP